MISGISSPNLHCRSRDLVIFRRIPVILGMLLRLVADNTTKDCRLTFVPSDLTNSCGWPPWLLVIWPRVTKERISSARISQRHSLHKAIHPSIHIKALLRQTVRLTSPSWLCLHLPLLLKLPWSPDHPSVPTPSRQRLALGAKAHLEEIQSENDPESQMPPLLDPTRKAHPRIRVERAGVKTTAIQAPFRMLIRNELISLQLKPTLRSS